MSTEIFKTKQNGASFNKKELKRRITEFAKMGATATAFTTLGYVAGYVNRPQTTEEDDLIIAENTRTVDEEVIAEQIEDTPTAIDEASEPTEEANVIDEPTDEQVTVDKPEVAEDVVSADKPETGTTEEEIAKNITAIEIDSNDLTLQNFFERNNLTPVAHQRIEINGYLTDLVYLRDNFGSDYAMIDYDGNGIFDIVINRNYEIVGVMRDNLGHDLGYTVDDVLAYIHDLTDGSDYIAGDFIDDPSDDLLADITDPTTQKHPTVAEISANSDDDDLIAQHEPSPDDAPYDEADTEDNFDNNPSDEADSEGNFDEGPHGDVVGEDIDVCLYPAEEELEIPDDESDGIDDLLGDE